MATERTEEYDSSPIVLGIAGAIIVGAIGGWILLNYDSSATVDEQGAEQPVLAIALPRATDSAVSVDDEIDAVVDIEAELRKARFAADADLLVSPPQQNALYFYGRVLATDPENPVANAELDAVMAGISMVVDDHLSVGEFDEAYDLSLSAARLMPEHPLVEAMRTDLDSFASSLVTEATSLAEEGNDEEAESRISTLEGLPGLSTAYVAAARETILEIQQSRETAEQEQADAEQVETELADLTAWQDRVLAAIEAGDLITPDGESARDILAEREVEPEISDQLNAELHAALVSAGRTRLESGELIESEPFLLAAAEINDSDEIIALQSQLEQTLIEQESSTVVALSDFVRLDTVAAQYPERAHERSVTGWVDVTFTVTTAGETANINVLRAQPENFFEESAMTAVEQWTFEPKQFRGQPIDQNTVARLVFDLQ